MKNKKDNIKYGDINKFAEQARQAIIDWHNSPAYELTKKVIQNLADE
ncbi:hypothetical protein [Mycoplasma seminis]|uniref:Uncharacterized protein n=1 Tax=Mycoplasma seminis TaxID=512749 RepID=A0ABY9H985_9MOLU|nr:hypothetical protein [Mycoplasma seminis]WLP85149.1 hypothetical protein Q8852_02375 [Mycoplasma seminis]